MKFDSIGMFKGKFISKMTREELLEFALWAGQEITRLQKIEVETSGFMIEKEISNSLLN